MQKEYIRFYIQTEVKCDIPPTEIIRKLQTAWPNECPSNQTIYRFCKEFHEGRTSLEDSYRCGRPSSTHCDSLIKRVKDEIEHDRNVSLRNLSLMFSRLFVKCGLK